MHVMGTRTIPATEERQVEYHAATRCDLCHEEITPPVGYITDEITVSSKKGSVFPDSGHTVAQEFDVCRKCWERVVLPWFRSHGAEPRIDDQMW